MTSAYNDTYRTLLGHRCAAVYVSILVSFLATHRLLLTFDTFGSQRIVAFNGLDCILPLVLHPGKTFNFSKTRPTRIGKEKFES